MTTSLRLGSCWVLVYLLGTPCVVLGQTVQLVPGSTTPRIQLTGEHFQIYSNGKYFTDFTPARTLSRFGVLGTDLGIPVSFPDKIVLLFGDTVGVYPSGSQYRQARTGPNGAADVIGYIPNADFSQCRYIGDVDQQLAQGVAAPNVSSAACPSLSVYTDPSRVSDGQVFKPMVISGLLAGESQATLRVPTGGFAYNDRLYMFYITMIQDPGTVHYFALQSIAARSDQSPGSWSTAAPPTFGRLYTVSSHPPIADPANPPSQAGDIGKFMFNSPVVMDAAKIAGAGLTQGLPAALQNVPNVVFVFGTSWRPTASNSYLAAFSLSDADAGPSKWFYYKGGNQWSASEADAAPLLASSEGAEQSVVWNSALRRFVLMRTGSGSVQAQFSTSPWGPWSDPVSVLSRNDTWINKLLHRPGADPLVQSLIRGASLTAASSGATSGALRAAETESDAAVTVAHGYGELAQMIAPGESGSRAVEVKQGDRIELRLPRGFDSACQLDAGGQRRALPTGVTWDEASGIFYWQPAPAFLGRYRLVFSSGSERISVGVVVRP